MAARNMFIEIYEYPYKFMTFARKLGRPHGGAPTDRSGGTLAAAIEMFVKLARHWWSDTFVRVVGRPHGGDPTDWSGCRGRHPLQNL